MNKQALLDLVAKPSMKETPPQFEIGDTVDVHTKILEGQKERIQVFSGTVIARAGRGVEETFTVRRIVAGEGVERKFPIHSPRVDKVEVTRSSVVRRAKLYFLRNVHISTGIGAHTVYTFIMTASYTSCPECISAGIVFCQVGICIA